MKFIALLALLLPSLAQSGEVTLHFIPAPTRTDWRSPQKLALSAVKNQLAPVNGGQRHEIGHAYVELSCRGTHFFTGTTSDGNSEERKDLFLTAGRHQVSDTADSAGAGLNTRAVERSAGAGVV